jgi:hypothetical protein
MSGQLAMVQRLVFALRLVLVQVYFLLVVPRAPNLLERKQLLVLGAHHLEPHHFEGRVEMVRSHLRLLGQKLIRMRSPKSPVQRTVLLIRYPELVDLMTALPTQHSNFLG